MRDTLDKVEWELAMQRIKRCVARPYSTWADIAKHMAKEGRPEAWRELTGKRYRPKIRQRGETSYRAKVRRAFHDAKLIRKFLPIEERRKPHDAAWLAAKIWGVQANDVRDFSENSTDRKYR